MIQASLSRQCFVAKWESLGERGSSLRARIVRKKKKRNGKGESLTEREYYEKKEERRAEKKKKKKNFANEQSSLFLGKYCSKMIICPMSCYLVGGDFWVLLGIFWLKQCFD